MDILCFVAGTAFFCLKSIYPVCLLLIFLFFRPRVSLLACFCVGFFWSAMHQGWVATRGFPVDPVINHASVQGMIVSIPVVNTDKVQFELLTEMLDGRVVRARLLLSCYDHCPDLRAGECWRVNVKLKKPRNFGNPGGFDYLASLNAHHIQWTGYTQKGSFERINGVRWSTGLLRLRQRLADQLSVIDLDLKTLGVLQALTLGVSHRIDRDMWRLFRQTGTTHLMVISGAHIGLVAGLTYFSIVKMWCCSRRLLCWVPAQRVASIGALLMALLYALLAGFGVPAERALIVCVVLLG